MGKHHQQPNSVRSFYDAAVTASETDSQASSDAFSNEHQHGYTFKFDRAGIVGRDKEKRVLSNAINQLLQRKHPPRSSQSDDTDIIHSSDSFGADIENGDSAHRRHRANLKTVCFISGPSGSGKSALAMHYKQHCLDNFAFFISGKFDLQQMEEPYAGIKTAMGQLVEQIQALPHNDIAGAAPQDPRRLSMLRQSLIRRLSSNELKTLYKIIPDLSELLTGEGNGNSNTDRRDSDQGRGIFGDDGASAGGDASTSSHFARQLMLMKQASITSTSTSGSGADGLASSRDSFVVAEGYREKSDRIKHTLRRFLRIICKHSPLVMMMDDIQWADKASLDIIQAWVMDGEISSLMIVGCFRSNELEQSPGLKDMMQALQHSKRERSIRVLDIPIQDLSLQSIRHLLIEILLPDNDDDVNGLADIVHRKTGGNIFFTKQFLESLVYEKLLSVDEEGGMKWVWDEHKIISGSSATANMVDLMEQKLARLDAARHVLPIAACLGSTFSNRRLILVIRAMSIHSDHKVFFNDLLRTSQHGTVSAHPPDEEQEQADLISQSGIQRSLNICEREGIIEKYLQPSCRERSSTTSAKHGCRYAFIHDQVQEAALSLVPQHKLSELRHRVGDVLLTSYSQGKTQEDKVYMIAGLINARLDLVPATDQHSDRRMKIAMLNSNAGHLAVECAAFQAALEYFRTAIQLLPPDHSKTHPHESIAIFSSAAECAYINANIDEMKRYCSTILSLDCSILHKIGAYRIVINGLFMESHDTRTNETLPTTLDVLSQLGCKFPKSKVGKSIRLVRGLLKIKRAASKWTVDSFRNRPSCNDPTQVAAMLLLDLLSTIAYLVCPEWFPLVILECVERTLKHGILPHSSSAFAHLSSVFGYFMGDFKTAATTCAIALQMTDYESNHNNRGRVIFILNIGTVHWMNPIDQTLGELQRAHELGMACGDVSSGVRSISSHVINELLMGKPLAQLDEDMLKFSNMTKEYQDLVRMEFFIVSWQMLQNFRGFCDNEMKLKGDVFDEDAFFQQPPEKLDETMFVVIHGYRQMLAAFFSDFEVGAIASIKVFDKQLKKTPGVAYLPFSICCGGVCCYAASHAVRSRSKAARYRRHGDRCRKQLRKWAELGNPNCRHSHALLQAEHKMLRSKYDSAIARFKDAIDLATSCGFTNDQALANERLSECLMRMGMDDAADQALDEAIRLYEKWGATGKVEKLRLAREKYG